MSNATKSSTIEAPALMRVQEVADKCQVSRFAVRRWLITGVRGLRLNGTMMGGTWRVAQADLDTFLAELTKKVLPADAPPTMTADSSREAIIKRSRAARERLRAMGV